MLQMLRFAVLLWFLSLGASDDVSIEANWDLFELTGQVNRLSSLEMVKTLPLYQYWDLSKKHFRTGPLAEYCVNSSQHASLVSSVVRKVATSNGAEHVNTLIIDTPTLFIQALAALQELSSKVTIPTLKGQLVHDKIEPSFRNRTFSSLAVLSAQQDIIRLKRRAVSLRKSALKEKQEYKSKNLDYRTSTKTELSEKIHGLLVTAQDVSRSSIIAIINNKFEELTAAVIEQERSRLQGGNINIRKETEITKETIKIANNVSIETILFQTQEIIRAAQYKHEQNTYLVAAKSEMLQAYNNELVSTVATEVTEIARAVSEDPSAALSFMWTIGAFLATVLVLIEMTHLISDYLKFLTRKPQRPQMHGLANNNSSGANACYGRGNSLDSEILTNVVTTPKLRWELLHAGTSLKTALVERLPLPNILLTGPSGTGKSLVCKLFAVNVLGAEHVYLSGSDLQAMGATATLYLNQLFQSAVRGGKRVVLIIEDADALLCTQKRGAPISSSISNVSVIDDTNSNNVSTHTTSVDNSTAPNTREGARSSDSPKPSTSPNYQPTVNGCLYALLTGLRNSSAYVGLILTTRLPCSRIDKALLNRIDHAVIFGLPLPPEQIQLTLAIMNKFLSEYLCSNDQNLLKRLVLHDSGSDGNSRLFSSILEHPLPHTANTAEATSLSSPETDLPSTSAIHDSIDSVSCKKAYAVWLSNNLDKFSDEAFNPLLCIKSLVTLSDGWSNRDIEQFLMSIRYRIQSEERCVLTSFIWMRELSYTTDLKGQRF